MTTPRSRKKPTEIPTGRDAVSTAVLTAATELFGERGPTATSIRDIAERAGVNHGLVFRHFGAKQALVGAVLNHLAAESADALTGPDPASDPRLRRHWTVLARCILDGYPVGELQDRFPVIAHGVAMVRERGADERTAALTVAHAAAFRLGWEMFRPFLRAAAGLTEMSETELDRSIDRRLEQLLELD
ncbi:TetR/AcrR family transcriptional regulator [Nocardia stercoris]|uniref:TetR/AcrR family transcriptional regulator n=1 Tax=Nocardia stercoris TaxID=2483361 RepID=A0A3M2L9U8_9NOCA|nr:TetR/AcrR family transcriptional regulator [Nocardia stercoris]RMI33323.1 TetR/AcrR family transcriptional regulator [Nocardia stercoris]